MRRLFTAVPLMAWLLGALVAAWLERFLGIWVVDALGLPALPAIFGLSNIFAEPLYVPHTALYLLLVYLLPMGSVAWLTRRWLGRMLARLAPRTAMLLHICMLYAVLHVWGHTDDYRLLVLRLVGISIILTTSLNLVNGWMGEFSVSVAGFMSIGAYVSSVLMVWGFVPDDVFGAPLLAPALAPVAFPVVLVLGGVAAALSALLVAIPSFRTRGDYLAIISLAYVFIVKSAVENLEFIGGPRGFMNQPMLAGLPVVFIWTLLCLLSISSYVTSTYGKATSAVRDNESAAEAVTVDTRRVKVVAFLTHAFWSGIAGGLYAHVIGYINPSNFGIIKSAEVLAMLYLGGLSSITGSVLGTVLFQILSEVLRPLKLIKWLAIPVFLIVVMIFRPRGLFGFRELRLPFLRSQSETTYGLTGD